MKLNDERHQPIRQGRTNVCVCGLLMNDRSAHYPTTRVRLCIRCGHRVKNGRGKPTEMGWVCSRCLDDIEAERLGVEDHYEGRPDDRP